MSVCLVRTGPPVDTLAQSVRGLVIPVSPALRNTAGGYEHGASVAVIGFGSR